ncbi:MAG: hypothetical protein EOO01_41820 [Chitinophagaceae bacterium]|nr:MAG: hypothetical protein EOO01_41820 [Chitinophagaceae bacterium]
MKKFFFVSVLASALLLGCNNNKPGAITVKSEDGKTTTTVNAGDMATVAEDYQKKAEELQKLAPYTLDQLKAMLPEEIGGAKRAKYSANSAMGAAYAEGEYPMNDSTQVNVKIFDCAGQAGAGIYSMQYLGMMNFQSESDEEYTKTVDFNGSRAVEHLDKNDNEASFMYLAGDRLLVTVEGRNTDVDMLRKIASNLNLK